MLLSQFVNRTITINMIFCFIQKVNTIVSVRETQGKYNINIPSLYMNMMSNIFSVSVYLNVIKIEVITLQYASFYKRTFYLTAVNSSYGKQSRSKLFFYRCLNVHVTSSDTDYITYNY